jgi:Fur family ferric uptake transcriptional regulator
MHTMKHKLTGNLEQLCKANGLRLTRPRRAIIQVLADSTDHPDATELHRRATQIDPDIAIATVYRTVSLLQENGILSAHTFADGRARYEATGQGHHDHLIDMKSGKVVEFESKEIERLQEKIAREHGYQIVSHRLEIYVVPLKKGRKPKATPATNRQSAAETRARARSPER